MNTIAQLRLQLEIAEYGLAMPYDAERVRDLKAALAAARKRQVHERLARMRARRRELQE